MAALVSPGAFDGFDLGGLDDVFGAIPGDCKPPEATAEFWKPVVKSRKELGNFGENVRDYVGGILGNHTTSWIRTIPNQVDTTRAELEGVRERVRRTMAASRSGVLPDDPEYNLALALEEQIDDCTARALQLHQSCDAYRRELAHCKEHVCHLVTRKKNLETSIRDALRANQIIESAGQDLTARGYYGVPSAIRLADPLPPPSLSARQSRAHCPRFPLSARERRHGTGRGTFECNKLPQSIVGEESAAEFRSSFIRRSAIKHEEMRLPSVSQPDENMIKELQKNVAEATREVTQLRKACAEKQDKRSRLEEFFLRCINDYKNIIKMKSGLELRRQPHDSMMWAVLKSDKALSCLYEKIFPHRKAFRSLRGPARGLQLEGTSNMYDETFLREQLAQTSANSNTEWDTFCNMASISCVTTRSMRRDALT